MLRLASLSIRRPLAALIVATVVAVALAAIGLGVDHSLSPSIVIVPGSESSRAAHLYEARFGPSELVPILLQSTPGEVAKLESQGPALVRALARRPHTRVLSAWDTGAAAQGLRPSRTAAMIVVSVDRPEKDVVDYDQPQIEALVRRQIASPVRASVTGQASIDRALKETTLSQTRRAELIAVAILFVLLLIGLRAPLAALLVAVVGEATVLAGFGLMTLLGKAIATDPLAVGLASMTGLALGVGYSLLILDRFHREELQRMAAAASPAPAATPASAAAPEAPTAIDGRGARGDAAQLREAAASASAAVAGTGRAVLFAGTGLILALLLASAIAPTTILTSLGIGVLLCSALAVGAAVVVMPAALVLLGRDVAVGRRAPAGLVRDWDRLVGAGAWVRHNAVAAGAVATAALLALAVPALSLKTGPPGASELPSGNSARVAYEEVARVMGPGWPTPYNLIVASPSGPITTAPTLERLEKLQTRISHDPAVASVAGPGALSAQTKPLGRLPKSLQESSKLLHGGKKDLDRLANGLGEAGSGAKKLQGGLVEATTGAGKLHSGSGAAHSGAAELHTGLAKAQAGSAALGKGLGEALAGAHALKTGATQALAGSVELASGLSSVHAPAAAATPSMKQLQTLTADTNSAVGALQGQAQSATGDVASALAALEGAGPAVKADPHYAEAVAALRRASESTGAVSGGLNSAAPNASSAASLASSAATRDTFLASALGQLSSGSEKLEAGLAKLHAGNAQLASGIGRLSSGGGELTAGLTRLRDGAGELETGLGALEKGTGELQSGLAGGVSPTGQLVSGLGVMQAAVAKFSGQLPSPRELEELKKASPGLFNSGYFLLAAIEGAPASASNEASFAVNVARGGTAGQIVVISRYPASDPRTARLGERLEAQARRFALANHLEVALGGPAGNLENYASATNASLPWVILALAVAVALTLGIALRAVGLPVVAVLFNLLTAAATFGVLSLLFSGANPPLGGPGYLNPMSVVGIFAIVFGVSLVYLTVLLTRTREELVNGSDVDAALDKALRETAAASTGTGLLMIAALVPFAASSLIAIREVGVGVAVAVALDAFLVRPVLLPAAVEALGPRAWWPTKCRQVRRSKQQSVPMGGGGAKPRVASAELK
ncbi:MAG TPA: MMPL family transporter [Solirubrobacteraceae bacterium]|nr:MMPL family transporter [Solirubrobacteraceae bacterium]